MNPFTLLIHYGLPFLCVLTILVFIHELGHYLVARWNRVRVEVFSIGFGPEIFGWTDRAGTRWKVSLLPFGGYVRMFGEVASEEAEGAEQKPHEKHVRHQISRAEPPWFLEEAEGPFQAGALHPGGSARGRARS